MKLSEHIYDLRGIISRNKLTDDTRLDDRLLKEWVHTHRAVWIRRESSKGGWQADRQIGQDITCPLEVSDRSKVSNLVTGGSILRTALELPKTIELRNRTAIMEVGPIDKIALPFSFVPLHRARTFASGKFNQGAVCAFEYARRIYLWALMTNESFLKYLRYIGVHGIFQDPTEAAIFSHVNGDACYTDNDEYPMNAWMWKFMREEILEANFELLTKAPTDTVNDANDQTR